MLAYRDWYQRYLHDYDNHVNALHLKSSSVELYVRPSCRVLWAPAN